MLGAKESVSRNFGLAFFIIAGLAFLSGGSVVRTPFSTLSVEVLPAAAVAILALVGFGIGLVAVRSDVRRKAGAPLTVAIGTLWVAAPALALLALHRQADSSTLFRISPALLAIVPLWGGDTAAIFAGKAFGKRKLAPAISPNKTWEGSIANLLACIAVATPLALAYGQSALVGIGCGIVAGTLGQAGDLFESWVKRQAGVKDSGTLLPGHGGIMDRIDSILFTAPAVLFILWIARL